MTMETNDLYRQYSELLAGQDFQEEKLDYDIVQRHITMLEQLDAIGGSAISIFDMYRRNHAYLSENFSRIFGWDLAEARKDDTAYGDSRVHPDDRLQLLKAGIYFLSLALTLPPQERKDYKTIADYRVIGAQGTYVRVVEQQSMLELDNRGNVWLALSVLDLSPYRDLTTAFRCRALNFKTGELFLFPPEGQVENGLLTMREKEVLHLVSKGLVSREIADLLYISVNTVNTHRQRIIEKLAVSNTSEAVRYAMDLGLLSG